MSLTYDVLKDDVRAGRPIDFGFVTYVPERTWHDFSDELPPAGVSVLCRGKNGALYVGKPVTLKGNATRRVWVPRGDQYRTPEKWMEIEE